MCVKNVSDPISFSYFSSRPGWRYPRSPGRRWLPVFHHGRSRQLQWLHDDPPSWKSGRIDHPLQRDHSLYLSCPTGRVAAAYDESSQYAILSWGSDPCVERSADLLTNIFVLYITFSRPSRRPFLSAHTGVRFFMIWRSWTISIFNYWTLWFPLQTRYRWRELALLALFVYLKQALFLICCCSPRLLMHLSVYPLFWRLICFSHACLILADHSPPRNLYCTQ